MYHKTLPRLNPDAYHGYAHVFFTNVTWQRRTLFHQRATVDICSAILRRCCVETKCECLVYVFMPDHVHLILHGTDDTSDVLHCHQMWKGRTGAALVRHLAQDASQKSDQIAAGSGSTCSAGFTGEDQIAAGSGSTCSAGFTGEDQIAAASGSSCSAGFTGEDQIAAGSSSTCSAGLTGEDQIAAGSGSTCSAASTGEDRMTTACGPMLIWQHRGYDHVLRRREYERRTLRKMIRYILENPVRKQLAAAWQEYPFLGSMIGEHDIRHPYWWDWFYA